MVPVPTRPLRSLPGFPDRPGHQQPCRLFLHLGHGGRLILLGLQSRHPRPGQADELLADSLGHPHLAKLACLELSHGLSPEPAQRNGPVRGLGGSLGLSERGSEPGGPGNSYQPVPEREHYRRNVRTSLRRPDCRLEQLAYHRALPRPICPSNRTRSGSPTSQAAGARNAS